MLDADQLSAGLNMPRERAEHWIGHLTEAMEAYNIESSLRQAAFIAQCAHESAFFTRWVENLNYTTAEGIRRTYGSKRFPTVNSAQMYVRNPQLLANKVYANRLGNGDTASGDGWRYRGRGFIQITGRTNYGRAAESLEEDYLELPELLEREDRCALVSAFWWADNGCNEAADSGDIDRVTRIVNGPAMHGREERERIYRDMVEVLIV